MRRGSVVGPLILIGIGGVFLLNNLRPEWSAIDALARFWPYLLIVWGLLRLIEVLYWSQRQRPVPTQGVSGGEWVLVVLIAFVGSGMFVFRESGPWNRWTFGRRVIGAEVFGEKFDYPLSAEQPSGSAKRIVIDLPRGNAHIIGNDGTEVRVSGRQTVSAFNKQEADRLAEQCPLQVSNIGDTVMVRANQDRVLGDRRIMADLEITVPKGFAVECKGRYGDFELNDLQSSVEVNSDNAGVRLQNIGGDVRVNLGKSDIIRAVNVKGTVDLKGRGDQVELENIGGQVTVYGNYAGDLQLARLAKALVVKSTATDLRVEQCPGQLRLGRSNLTGNDLVGPVVLNSRVKDVQISGFSQSMDISLDHGNVELSPGKGPLGKLDVRLRAGDIMVALPDKAPFALNATSNRGEIQNEYGSPLDVETIRQRSVMRGAVGQGPAVTLTTDHGVITVRKGEEAVSSISGPRNVIHDPRSLKELKEFKDFKDLKKALKDLKSEIQ